MVTLAQVTVSIDAKSVAIKYSIPPDAHAWGIAAKEWRRVIRMLGRNFQDDGAELIEGLLDTAVSDIARELRGAWEQDPLF